MNSKIVFIITVVVLVGGAFWFASSPRSGPVQQEQETQVIELKNGGVYNLTASYVTKVIAGREQKMLAYNGMIPGPEINVVQGAEVTINFKNDTDMPALLHSHGIRMDNAFDGSQLQQKDIPPGGSYSYTLKFQDAGVFWYHPHVNEVYGQALGLFGGFIVTPTDINYYPPVNSEHVLFLSDLPIKN